MGTEHEATAFNSAYISSQLSHLAVLLNYSIVRRVDFLHLFDFGCDLITATLNLGLTFATAGNREFTNAEAPVVVRISVMAINTITNKLFHWLG